MQEESVERALSKLAERHNAWSTSTTEEQVKVISSAMLLLFDDD